jgi:hypothetical protein
VGIAVAAAGKTGAGHREERYKIVPYDGRREWLDAARSRGGFGVRNKSGKNFGCPFHESFHMRISWLCKGSFVASE